MHNFKMSVLVLLILMGMCSALVCNIVTSPVICPNELKSCINLSQFTANTSQCLDSNTTVTVIVLEGEHSLDSQFLVEHIMTFSISSSHNIVIACENSTVLHFHKIGYAHLYNFKFRGCQFTVRRVDNFYLVNVEITDLTAMFTTALQLIQVNTNIKKIIF